MLRKDREITDAAEIGAILAEAAVGRIGLSDDGKPYVVPVCFGYGDGSVFIHSAPAGKKTDILKNNPRVCFEADLCDGLIRDGRPCAWGMRYRSVIGYGRAVFVEDPAEKRRGLNIIMQHYAGREYEFSDRDVENVTVIRIDLESVTGKRHG